ncbi:MAG: UDP-N-acetylmuramoyl-L-alanyl-D-glutamate--2,6-diaminopimelate ligase [Oscillospiraceae bacterium]|nr:UDP-N-acetylmuramoyl-L-alanyl-D-glutamate--2,6-diaminopimelate ligase [Oscillospiraceae bacterium]
MKLFDLMNGIPFQGNLENREIGMVTSDSRQITPGCLFVCIAGARFDGHTAARQVLADGAAAVVCEKDLGLDSQLLVADSREAYGIICSNFYGNPSRKIKLIGITGTNGKTTCTYLIKHLLESAGKKVGLIGTIHNEIGDMVLPAKNTTPDPGELHVLFMRMAQAGCEYVVMEASSHALDQKRLSGCRFAVGVFTNLTQDHLDYHITMEAYYQAKKKLFDLSDAAVVNLDDAYGRRLAKELSCPVRTFSIWDDAADFTARDIRPAVDRNRFTVVGESQIGRVDFPMPGEFSVANAMAAGIAALTLGMTLQQVCAGLSSCPGIPGRTEVLSTGTDFTVIRDYAHTPDGLEKVLPAIKPFVQNRLMVLFGCAGERDPSKRIHMAEAVVKYADYMILTSDNPRREDPVKIIEDALPGFEGTNVPYEVIPDRYKAIEWALAHAQPGDVLLLAGKGHEDYQVLDYGTIHFDEREVVARLLAEQRKSGSEGVL